MKRVCQSWGRYPAVDQEAINIDWPGQKVDFGNPGKVLPRGQGRSYGDACLNAGGAVLWTERLDRFIAFDSEKGILRCEAGVTLEQILDAFVPRGWFIPVSPGTKFVSVGGAIANDIHGKNHHSAGTFGRHVRQFELLRSDGSRAICSPTSNRELFEATIAGLGLTGLIISAEIQLKPIPNAFIDMESIKFGSLDEFFSISSSSDRDFEYTVAWLDCVSSGDSFGRGIFMRGNNSRREQAALPKIPRRPKLMVPIDFPGFALNSLSIKAFNAVYYGKQRAKSVSSCVYYDPFFYPLDAVLHWNRIYGKRGFLQFQCVVPSAGDNRAIREILKIVVASGRASFLAVLKEFGDLPSPGMLSFPRKGVTLCLDFPFHGESTLKLFARLDQVVREAGGAIYPAKDACMPPQSFDAYYPRWREFSRFIDPAFSSSFWRRVTAGL